MRDNLSTVFKKTKITVTFCGIVLWGPLNKALFKLIQAQIRDGQELTHELTHKVCHDFRPVHGSQGSAHELESHYECHRL